MIKNFDELKKQLVELSSVINSFKSEAVQLKILELVFQDAVPSEIEVDKQSSTSSSSKSKSSRAKPKKSRQRKPAYGKSGRTVKKIGKVGPATVLTELISQGYFDKARTISDIIGFSEKKKARKFKANELSGPLARFVRDGRLDREKNADNQYEYTKG